MDNDDWEMADEEEQPAQAPRTTFVRATTQAATIQAILAPVPGPEPEEEEAEEDDDDDGEDEYYRAFRHNNHSQYFPEVTEPQEAGVKLLQGGDFGRVANKIKSRSSLNVARQLRSRASQRRPRFYKEDYASDLIPNCNGTTVSEYDANVYTAQYSADSSFFYTCSQDFRLNIFDTTVPPVPRKPGVRQEAAPNLKSTMKVMNSIQAHPGRWTISDANLSPDNERMIYSSIASTVYMTSTTDPAPTQIPIPFADPPGSRSRNVGGWGGYDGYRIYSCRFSADGKEIIAGGNGQLFVYDLLANRRTVKIEAHRDDVNSCTWADTSSGNVLVSASDDSFLKVWDRRSLGVSQKPSGVLMGHTEGITYVSAKGDGRYVISNGKDQKLRLWDLRKMRSNQELEAVQDVCYGTKYDYRYPNYPRPKFRAHPKDCSVMTFHGHTVLRTLIRCHFSPSETTGGQYIYSGSADGRVHIWSLDGRVVQVLDRAKTLPMTFDPSAAEDGPTQGRESNVCVRDVSWHSQEPVLMSAGWENGRGGSRVARHEWKGLSKMGGALEDWVEKKTQEGEGARRSSRLHQLAARARRETMPGSFEAESYFIVRAVASNRLLDVTMDSIEDGTELALWPEKDTSIVESAISFQVFFIDTSGALCSRSSGHAIDVEGDCLVLRHRRPISLPFPNSYAHPLPKFSYSATTGEISVHFASDPTHPAASAVPSDAWTKKTYILASVPLRKPRTMLDDAQQFISSAITLPFSLFSAAPAPQATPEAVFSSDIDLGEDEVLEEERGEEAEVDDSPEWGRSVRVLGIVNKSKEEREIVEKARNRRRWQITPLRQTNARTG
ncbi:WD40 repeat-like protein [Mycena belliarum]|uniref:WD40 repeat-like protein n=1 Tax=Mycena belliarum TaxID=1033014 RepID=A0AAD6TLI3_9AGAR|nr:WD40 repeat-like protein [Mycena belliae]